MVEIGILEVDIYIKDFFFFDFLKNFPNDFFLIGVLIKSHELLVVYKF